MFVFRVFLCLCLLMLMPAVSVAGCLPGDPPCPQYQGKKYCPLKNLFGATSGEGVAYNYNYYDAIFVAKIVSYERKPNGGKIHVLQMDEIIKNTLELNINELGIFRLNVNGPDKTWFQRQKEKLLKVLHKHNKDKISLPIIERHFSHNVVKAEAVCRDVPTYVTHAIPKDKFLFFVKGVSGYKKPIIVRMVSIDEGTYDVASEAAIRADVVFIGTQEDMNDIITPQLKHQERRIKILRTIKGDKREWQGEVILKTFGVCEKCRQFIDKDLEYGRSNQKIFYLEKNAKYDDMYYVAYVREDIETELKLYREIKLQE